MFDFLARVFGGKASPRPHHEFLEEEAERTGDSSRLNAEIIVKWAWDKYDNTPFVASAEDLIQNLSVGGMKPLHLFSDEEKNNMSAGKALVCEALERIQKTGTLDAQMGHNLRHYSETGEAVYMPFASREPVVF